MERKTIIGWFYKFLGYDSIHFVQRMRELILVRAVDAADLGNVRYRRFQRLHTSISSV